MQFESKYNYKDFLESWAAEQGTMTTEEVDELVRELAESYYICRTKYSRLVVRIQTALKEER